MKNYTGTSLTNDELLMKNAAASTTVASSNKAFGHQVSPQPNVEKLQMMRTERGQLFSGPRSDDTCMACGNTGTIPCHTISAYTLRMIESFFNGKPVNLHGAVHEGQPKTINIERHTTNHIFCGSCDKRMFAPIEDFDLPQSHVSNQPAQDFMQNMRRIFGRILSADYHRASKYQDFSPKQLDAISKTLLEKTTASRRGGTEEAGTFSMLNYMIDGFQAYEREMSHFFKTMEDLEFSRFVIDHTGGKYELILESLGFPPHQFSSGQENIPLANILLFEFDGPLPFAVAELAWFHTNASIAGKKNSQALAELAPVVFATHHSQHSKKSVFFAWFPSYGLTTKASTGNVISSALGRIKPKAKRWAEKNNIKSFDDFLRLMLIVIDAKNSAFSPSIMEIVVGARTRMKKNENPINNFFNFSPTDSLDFLKRNVKSMSLPNLISASLINPNRANWPQENFCAVTATDVSQDVSNSTPIAETEEGLAQKS